MVGLQNLPRIPLSKVVQQMDLLETLDLCMSSPNIRTAASSPKQPIFGLKWIIASPGHCAINLIFEEEDRPSIIFKFAETSPLKFCRGSLNGRNIRFARSKNIFTVECGPNFQDKLQIFEDLTQELIWTLQVKKFHFYSNLFVDFVFNHTKSFESFTLFSQEMATYQLRLLFEEIEIEKLELIYDKAQLSSDQNPDLTSCIYQQPPACVECENVRFVHHQTSEHVFIANLLRRWANGEADHLKFFKISNTGKTYCRNHQVIRLAIVELGEFLDEHTVSGYFVQKGGAKRADLRFFDHCLSFELLV